MALLAGCGAALVLLLGACGGYWAFVRWKKGKRKDGTGFDTFEAASQEPVFFNNPNFELLVGEDAGEALEVKVVGDDDRVWIDAGFLEEATVQRAS
jgi:hypothetical protein